MSEKLETFNVEIYKMTSSNNMPRLTEVEALSADKMSEIEAIFQLNV